MWVYWNFGKYGITSRAEDFSVSVAFIASHETAAVGSRLDLHFSLPEGQVKAQAVVRNTREGRGMGVEFVSAGGREFDLILKAAKRLLG